MADVYILDKPGSLMSDDLLNFLINVFHNTCDDVSDETNCTFHYQIEFNNSTKLLNEIKDKSSDIFIMLPIHMPMILTIKKDATPDVIRALKENPDMDSYTILMKEFDVNSDPRGKMIHAYIIDEEGYAWNNDGCQYVYNKVSEKFNNQSQLFFIMGQACNDPDALIESIENENYNAYLVVSNDWGLPVLTGEKTLKAVCTLLREFPGENAWTTISNHIDLKRYDLNKDS